MIYCCYLLRKDWYLLQKAKHHYPHFNVLIKLLETLNSEVYMYTFVYLLGTKKGEL